MAPVGEEQLSPPHHYWNYEGVVYIHLDIITYKRGGRMQSILEPKLKLRFTHSILKIRLVLISFPSS